LVVTVNIPDELAAAAKARGLSLEAYVQEILAQPLASSSPSRQPRTPQAIRACIESLAQFSEKIPPLPEHVSRAWLYQDRDSMAIPSCLVDTAILLRMTRRSTHNINS
jgi:post-segregation antitoxin (ccd killing protein)